MFARPGSRGADEGWCWIDCADTENTEKGEKLGQGNGRLAINYLALFFVASLTFNEEQLQQRYTGIAQHGPGEPGGAASNEARGRDFPPVPLLFPGWKERERKESRNIKKECGIVCVRQRV